MRVGLHLIGFELFWDKLYGSFHQHECGWEFARFQ
jgi:hypothetical protein